ncbi:MAG: hypothetical protein EOM18_01500, partial [Clostridia bacterium]|nr:hypothetical protein [Clostridia bacterium]
MFADNQKISGLQAARQLFLVYLAPMTLWIAVRGQGRTGILSVGLGMGILCLWTFFLFRQAHVFRNPLKYWGTFFSRAIMLILQIYLILSGGWILYKSMGLIKTYLISGIAPWVVGVILVAAALGGFGNVQQRGRFSQVAGPILLTLIVIMLILAAFQGDSKYLEIQAMEKTISQNENMVNEDAWDTGQMRKIAIKTIEILAAFSGVIFLHFLQITGDQGESHVRRIFGTLGKMGIYMAALLLVLQAVYGEHGADSLEYPVLDLMAGARVPGGFVRRLDLVFLTVMIFAVMFSLGSIFFYSSYLLEQVKWPASRLPAAVICFVLAVSGGGEWSLEKEYLNICKWIFLPFFIALTICAAYIKKKKKVGAMLLPVLFLLLTGCQIVEPEKRSYPLAVGIEWDQDQYHIYFSMAGMDQSAGKLMRYSGRSKQEIMKMYNDTREYYLDSGHVLAVIFDEGLLRDEEHFKKVLLGLEQENVLGNSAYIFQTDDVSEVFGTDGMQAES